MQEQLSIAPMMGHTNRHCRYIARLMSHKTFLYTEMITAQAIVHSDKIDELLRYNEMEKPVVLQIGGGEPDTLAKASSIAVGFDYDEINLNMGCPSSSVQAGCFGAVLMKHTDRVQNCLEAIQQNAPDKPVTVKCRIGVDECEGKDYLFGVIEKIRTSGVKKIILHARKALLNGISPKENRQIPPLDYHCVYQVKKHFSDIQVIINGGIDFDNALNHLNHVDGVMIGRDFLQKPVKLNEMDQKIVACQDNRFASQNHHYKEKKYHDIISLYIDYVVSEIQRNTPINKLLKPLFAMTSGKKNGKIMRQKIAELIIDKPINKKNIPKTLENCLLNL